MIRTKYSRRKRAAGMRLLCASIIFGFGCNVVLAQSVGSNEGGTVPAPIPEFPANNWWNTDIRLAPVDPNSGSYISFLGGSSRHLHPDFGGNATYYGGNAIYGMPYVVVDGVAGAGKTPPPLQAVQFGYSDQSDGVDHNTDTSFPFYPIPPQATNTPKWIECGDPGSVDDRSNCDRHLLILDRDHKYLYELWNVWYDSAHSQWNAGSGAFFDLRKNTRRPNTWTSADAAGLAIFPGLVRYDEVYNAYGTNVGEIKHAFRFTAHGSNGFVYPASHRAGNLSGAPPMGMRLRLKASVDISGYPPEMQKIFQAMKTYGLILADNGSDMYISGTFDLNWDNNVLNPAFGGLKASDFRVIQLGWKPPITNMSSNPNPLVGGDNATGTTFLQDPAPTGGAVVTLSATSGLTVPASVTVPAGQKSATFAIGSSAVASVKNPIITGRWNGAEYKLVVRVEPPPTLQSLTVNPNIIVNNATATGTVTLDEGAPVAGTLVTLSSSDTSVATVPASVMVPAGATQATFTVTGKTVASKTTIVIHATWSGVTKNANFAVQPPG